LFKIFCKSSKKFLKSIKNFVNKKDLFTKGECFRKAQVSTPLRFARNDKFRYVISTGAERNGEILKNIFNFLLHVLKKVVFLQPEK